MVHFKKKKKLRKKKKVLNLLCHPENGNQLCIPTRIAKMKKMENNEVPGTPNTPSRSKIGRVALENCLAESSTAYWVPQQCQA